MLYLWIYLIIGVLYGAASVLKLWSNYNDTIGIKRTYADLKGYGHWSTYVVVFVFRLIAWPLFVIAGFIK